MVKKTFKETFLTKTRDEWTELAAPYDACIEPVMNLEEVSNDEHLLSRGMFPEVEVPVSDGVKVKQLGCPFNLSECPPEYKHAGYPEGYHTGEILGALGYSEEDIKEMVEK